jgi:hypothetical protein
MAATVVAGFMFGVGVGEGVAVGVGLGGGVGLGDGLGDAVGSGPSGVLLLQDRGKRASREKASARRRNIRTSSCASYGAAQTTVGNRVMVAEATGTGNDSSGDGAAI